MYPCTSNRAEEAFKPFLIAATEHGLPAHVRIDAGGENTIIKQLMYEKRGPGHVTIGSSVHNTRIERLWADYRTQVTAKFYDMFQSLERDGILDVEQPTDIFLLHVIYLEELQLRANSFVDSWNQHPIRTAGHKSPNQLKVLSQCQGQIDMPAIVNEVGFDHVSDFMSDTNETHRLLFDNVRNPVQMEDRNEFLMRMRALKSNRPQQAYWENWLRGIYVRSKAILGAFIQ